MMTKGLVERARALDDGRANTVTLTEAGRIALAEVEPAVQRADRRLLSLLSSSKREGFLAGMVRIIERSQDPEKFSARPEEGSPKRDKPQKKKKKKSGKTKKAPKISPAPAD
jgi:DNA-binding PadR family transcriptional regulator